MICGDCGCTVHLVGDIDPDVEICRCRLQSAMRGHQQPPEPEPEPPPRRAVDR